MAEFEPQKYGNFVLMERIAVGGMAEIFRAKKLGAEGFEKELVIKRILPHFSEDESFVTMFKDEARIAANLNHANIVQVYEFDEHEGTFYIAMEFIEGKDLKRILDAGAKRDKHLLPGECVYIIAQVADGLHYAHTRTYNGQPLNIVHRDVSPHNIMISIDGDVKLMDFGIAKAAARSTKTQAGTVKGKCAYMSPEQARGKDLDGRSDLFSLGICLWEMVTGQRLFVGETEFETLSKVLKAEIPPVRDFNSGVHPKLDKIIQTSLSRDRDQRYKDLGMFKQALMSFFYQHCDPDTIDLGAYMRWLYRKGPVPRSRENNAPPPTISAPVYRPPVPVIGGAAAPPAAVEPKNPLASLQAQLQGIPGKSAKPSPIEAPVQDFGLPEPSERTAVMPEMPSEEPLPPAKATPKATPQINATPDPTVPLEPYRPEPDKGGQQGKSGRKGGTGTSGKAVADQDHRDDPSQIAAVKGKTASMQPVDVGAVPGQNKGKSSLKGSTGRSEGKGGTKPKPGKKFPVLALVVVVVVLVLAAVGSVVGYLVLNKPDHDEPTAATGEPARTEAEGRPSGTEPTPTPAAQDKVSVEIISEPSGANLYLNGEDTMLTTPKTRKFKVGETVKIKVTKRGYKPATIDVLVKEGMEPVKIQMEKGK